MRLVYSFVLAKVDNIFVKTEKIFIFAVDLKI